ncbi:hypothetical protein COL516b_003847 [Colletotrichum fioriniae]|nr:uncharacterized protein COL516b_003847 [Colletotrichum fioriniae]KAJ0307875.1 hypothetical protein COL516b_003847 [Colletotrichum fioriniae]
MAALHAHIITFLDVQRLFISYANDNNVLDLGVVCSLLTGLYNKGEFRRICVHDKNGIKWDFELKVSTSNL